MGFHIFKVANQGDNSSKTKSFFIDVIDNAARAAAKAADVEFDTDTVTPDDEELPADLQKDLRKKLPCVLLLRPNGKYQVMQNKGQRAQWQQKFFEIFKGWDAPTVKKVDIYNIYDNADNQLRQRTYIDQHFPKDVPHTITELKSDNHASKAKGVVPNIVCEIGGSYANIIQSASGRSSNAAYSNTRLEQYFKMVLKAFNELSAGKSPDVVIKEQQTEIKKQQDVSPLDPLNPLKSPKILFTIYAIAGGFLAFNALTSRQQNVQMMCGAGAAFLLYKAYETGEVKL